MEYEDSRNKVIFAKKQSLQPYFLMEYEDSWNTIIFVKKVKPVALLFDGI